MTTAGWRAILDSPAQRLSTEGIMAQADRTMGRNGGWWRDYCKGMTMEAIAERDGVDKSTVSVAIKKVRDSLPQETRDEIAAELRDFYRDLRVQAMEIAALTPAPVTVGRDGTVLYDPITKQIVRDYSGRLRALETAAKMAEHERRMMGIDAPTKVEQTVTEQAAAERAAREAAARLDALNGENDDDGD